MLRVAQLKKEYKDKTALANINLIFPDKGLVIIEGESGSGKSTLLNMLTANDFPTSGQVEYKGIEINPKNAEQYRTQYCGNIYQDYMLIEDLTAKENIELALQVIGQDYTIKDISKLLKEVELPQEYIDKKVSKMSGGEKQRVAIARAISKKNAMIFADEPTGNLDSKNGEVIMELLKAISKDKLVVVVSHNERFNKEYADYTIRLKDGEVEYCDIPQERREESEKDTIEKTLNKRSKNLKAGTIARLAYWGFEKNKIKTIVSIIAFIVVCILSCMSLTAYFADLNWSLAYNLDQNEKRNIIINIDNPQNKIQATEAFCQEITYKPHLYYTLQFNKKSYIEGMENCPESLNFAIVYDRTIGADIDVLCGEFPQKPNQLMLPYNYALLLSQNKNCKIDDLVGHRVKYINTDKYYIFEICGIFDEGKYFNDYSGKALTTSEDIYLRDSNILADKVFIGYGAEKVFNYNSMVFSGHSAEIYDIRINDTQADILGYDEYASYAKKYSPLNTGEVYISSDLAKRFEVNAGDKLDIEYGSNKLAGYEVIFTKVAEKNNMIIKDILEDGYQNSIIMSTNEFEDELLVNGHQKYNVQGFYFNAKNIKNSYAFFNEISKKGDHIWTEKQNNNLLGHAFIQNLGATYLFFEGLKVYNKILILPLMCLSLLGMIAMGFVSVTYLLSSKDKSYNILRSIGCGKTNIALLLLLQAITIIATGCAIGIVLSCLGCYGLSQALIKILLDITTQLNPEYIMPLHWASPIILILISFAISLIAVLCKTKSMFSKSIIENKNK